MASNKQIRHDLCIVRLRFHPAMIVRVDRETFTGSYGLLPKMTCAPMFTSDFAVS